MSNFRPDSREGKSKTRLTARDQRLIRQIDHKKSDEQDNIIEQLEGPKNKTPSRKAGATTPVSSSVLQSPNAHFNKFLEERSTVEGRVKKRLRKLQAQKKNRKLIHFCDMWSHSGPQQNLICSRAWPQLGKQLIKIDSYEGFEEPDSNKVLELNLGSNHPKRQVLCSVCMTPVNSLTENIIVLGNKRGYHAECLYNK